MLRWLLFLSALAQDPADPPHSSNDEFEVPILVKEAAGVDRQNAVVTCGLPLARGELTGVPIGGPIEWSVAGRPTQTRVLALWPDGSVRWVLLRFLADLKAHETRSFRVIQSPSGKGSLVRLEAGELEVDTGAITFYSRRGGPLLGSLRSPERTLTGPTDQSGLVLVSADKELYRGWIEEIELIENGPIQAQIEFRGRFRNQDGEWLFPRATEQQPELAIRFRLWLTVTRDQSAIELNLALHNPGSNDLQAYEGPIQVDQQRYSGRDHLKQWLYFRELRFDVPLAQKTAWAVASSSGKGSIHQDETARVLQVYDGTLHGPLPHRFLCRIDIGEKHVREQQHPGWLNAQSSTHQITLGFQDFWQNWPKALEFRPDRATLAVFPRLERGMVSHISYPGAKSIFDVDSWTDGSKANEPESFRFPRHMYCLQGGRIKAHRMFIDFAPLNNRSPAKQQRAFASPLHAVAGGSYMLRSKALFGYYPDGILPESSTVLLSQAISGRKRWRYSLLDAKKNSGPTLDSALRETTERGWANLYGFANYGDLAWGGSQGHYCNLHYDWPYGLLMDFVRYGDPRFFALGDRMARYDREWGQYHHLGGMVWADGLSWYEASDHGFEPERPRRTHNWNGGVLLHYLLTGDVLSKDAVIENADGCYASFFWGYRLGPKLDKSKIFPSTREQGWAILAMLHGYELTHEQKYLDQCKRVLRQITLPTVEKAGGMRAFVREHGSLMFGYASLGFIKLYYALPPEDPARKEIVALLVDVADGVENRGVKTPAKYQNGMFTPPKYKDPWGKPSTTYCVLYSDVFGFLWKEVARHDSLQKRLLENLYTAFVHQSSPEPTRIHDPATWPMPGYHTVTGGQISKELGWMGLFGQYAISTQFE